MNTVGPARMCRTLQGCQLGWLLVLTGLLQVPFTGIVSSNLHEPQLREMRGTVLVSLSNNVTDDLPKRSDCVGVEGCELKEQISAPRGQRGGRA